MAKVTRPGIPLKVCGQSFEVHLDFATIARTEAALGMPLVQAAAAMSQLTLTMTQTATLVVALTGGDKLTVEQVGEWLVEEGQAEVIKTLARPLASTFVGNKALMKEAAAAAAAGEPGAGTA